MNEPITRSEMYLAALGGEAVTPPEPITRMDMYLAYLNGMTDTYPEPITRTEQYLYKLCQNGMGGGGGVTIRNQNKTITENGSYKADSGYTGLGTVTVNVPQEDPVLQDKTATQNGKYTADSGFDGLGMVTVAVPEPVLQDKTVTENGTVTADPGYDGLGVVTVNVTASGGGDDVARAIVERTITEYDESFNYTSIGKYALASCTALKTVNNSKLVSTGDYAFHKCTALENVNLPNLTEIAPYAFSNIAGIRSLEFPNATKIGAHGFDACNAFESVYFPKVTDIGSYAFGNWPLENLNDDMFPNAIAIGEYVFKGTTLKYVSLSKVVSTIQSFKGVKTLENVSLPAATKIGQNTFEGCTALKNVNLPSATSFSGNVFKGASLEKVSFPALMTIGNAVFYDCGVLKEIVLASNTVVTLSNINSFTGTPFASGGTGGTVYVPAALISAYQTATNWSTLYAAGTCNFVAIEGSEYE